MPARVSPSKPRDLRLDFFRGLALLLIFVAHVPNNWFAEYRPGAFGFSDSADIFVFVSGYAAALFYGKAFSRAGFWPATAKVIKRCGQLYTGHLGLFFTIAALCVLGNRILPTPVDYIRLLNLNFFFEESEKALLGLFTLTYVPNYFDILPMYIVELAMLPPLMLLARVRGWLALAACVALYIAVPIFRLELPAEIAFERPWFFNPFAWQLLFYTGFALAAGWIKPLPLRRWLAVSCTAYVIVSIPFSHYPTYSNFALLSDVRNALKILVSKTDLGVLRWLHFLCLAYLMVVLFKGREQVLHGRLAAPFVKTGQQALPVFLTGMALSFIVGMVLDLWGRTLFSVTVANVAGIVFLILEAYVVAWFKSEPWRVKEAGA